MSEARPAHAAAALALTLTLAACGFQLRGEPVIGLKTLYVSTEGASGVAGEIRRILAAGPTTLVPGPKGAEAQLAILGERRDKAVFTVTGTGRVYEFQLRLSVRFQLTVPGRAEPAIAPGEATTTRLITYSEAAPTAKEVEERHLYQDMQEELARRILRQIAAAKHKGL